MHNVKEGRIKSLLKRTKGENAEVLFHHRFATSTVDVRNACHPFSTKDHFENQYVGVHNGVLYNDNVLQKQHKELGIEYVSTQPNGTFNDSEALVYDLARYFEGEVSELTAQGSIAFIVVKRDTAGKPVTLFFGRNSGNPLKMKHTKHSLTLSSQGDGVEIAANTLYMFDYETEELRTRYMHIPYYTYSSSYSQSQSCSTYGKKEFGSWEEYIDNIDGDTDDVDDGTAYAREIRQHNQQLLSAGGNNIYDENEDFAMRVGSSKEIIEQFLEENHGSFTGAALSAAMELEMAKVEMKIMDRAIIGETDEDAQEAIINYWSDVSDYHKQLNDIVEEIYKLADFDGDGDLDEEEEKAERAFGFQPVQKPVQKGGLLGKTFAVK